MCHQDRRRIPRSKGSRIKRNHQTRWKHNLTSRIVQVLRRHGYEVSPGTMYPLLQRMERNGWLRSVVAAKGGVHARRSYYLTDKGRDVLEIVLAQLEELRSEVGRKPRTG